jgi:hypothetical protein
MTNLNAALDEVSRLWCATQPATDGPRYIRLDAPIVDMAPDDLGDDVADRGFFFTLDGSETIQETSSLELRESLIVANLYLSTQRVGVTGIRAALDEEMQKLSRVVDLQTSWPSGVSEVRTTERAQDEDEDATSLATGTISIVLLTEET